LVQSTSIAGVVVPGKDKFRWKREGAAPLIDLARKKGLRVHKFDARQQKKIVDAIEVRPDLICVATFPSILHREILAMSDRGGINLHWSLLPRHRGPDPLFWTYLNDDRTTGVTLHWLDERVDAGPILLQREIPLARGRPLSDVYRELAAIGGELFASAISLIRAGRSPRIEQDEKFATHERSPDAATWSIDTARWPAERVWHIVRGLSGRRASMLRDSEGRALMHGAARGYVIGKYDRKPGTIERTDYGWRVFCADGYVDVERAASSPFSWLARVIRPLRRRHW
jgi:methionyl-tRNA formyltransferase